MRREEQPRALRNILTQSKTRETKRTSSLLRLKLAKKPPHSLLTSIIGGRTRPRNGWTKTLLSR